MGCCKSKPDVAYRTPREVKEEIEYWLTEDRPYRALKLYRDADVQDNALGDRIDKAMACAAKTAWD